MSNGIPCICVATTFSFSEIGLEQQSSLLNMLKMDIFNSLRSWNASRKFMVQKRHLWPDISSKPVAKKLCLYEILICGCTSQPGGMLKTPEFCACPEKKHIFRPCELHLVQRSQCSSFRFFQRKVGKQVFKTPFVSYETYNLLISFPSHGPM